MNTDFPFSPLIPSKNLILLLRECFCDVAWQNSISCAVRSGSSPKTSFGLDFTDVPAPSLHALALTFSPSFIRAPFFTSCVCEAAGPCRVYKTTR